MTRSHRRCRGRRRRRRAHRRPGGRRGKGARVALVSPLAARPDGELLGAGQDRGRARAGRLERRPHGRHDRRRPRLRQGERGARVVRGESAARVRSPGARGAVRRRHQASWRSVSRRGTRRRIVHAGGAATGPAHHARAVRAGRHPRAHPRIRAAGGHLARDREALHQARRPRSRRRAAPDQAGAVVLATGGMAALLGRTTNPGALSAPASRLPTRRARSSRTSSSCSSIPPRCARAARATAASS